MIQTVWPTFNLRYTDPISGAPGSGGGIRMLLENQLDQQAGEAYAQMVLTSQGQELIPQVGFVSIR
ncbi:MAG: hypothetical protein QNJ46_15010 [Leptolyngbyaceae cyanobacterium MO_188.B28]|nr:hypothetical protein [Leptolyngbyaceae cyanobacterium MO_188.B28]